MTINRNAFILVGFIMMASPALANDGIRLGKWEITSAISSNAENPNSSGGISEMHSDIHNGTDNVTVNGKNSGTFAVPATKSINPNFKLDSATSDTTINGSTITQKTNAKSTVCVTQENRVPFKTTKNCKPTQVTTTGNTMDATVVCDGMPGMQMSYNAHIVYTDTTLDMTMENHMKINGHEHVMKSHSTGIYSGACDN